MLTRLSPCLGWGLIAPQQQLGSISRGTITYTLVSSSLISPSIMGKMIHSKLHTHTHTQRIESQLRSMAVPLFDQLYRRLPPVTLGEPGAPWTTKSQAHPSVLGLHDKPQGGTLVTPFTELVSFSLHPRTSRLHPETSAVST